MDAPPTSAELSVIREGDTLRLALSESLLAGRPQLVPLDDHALAELRSLHVGMAANPGTSASGAMETLAAALFQLLFPEALLARLEQIAADVLYLSIDEALLDLPWELPFRLRAELRERFTVFRRIVTASPNRTFDAAGSSGDQLSVFIKPAESSIALARAHKALRSDLAAVRDMELRQRDTSSVQETDSALDIVHIIAESTLPQVDALPRAQLTMLELKDGTVSSASVHELARELCLSGSNVLIIGSADDDAAHADKLRLFYKALSVGSTLGETLQKLDATSVGPADQTTGSFASSVYANPDLRLVQRTSPGETRPDRRQITMLFCDIVDSTRIASELGEERWSDLLIEFQAIARQVLETEGGFIARFLGDGVDAYFGYPRASENAAAHALSAGLNLVKALSRLPFAVRVAVHTGDVIMRNHSAEGEAAHLAGRLQALAEAGAVITSATTRALAGDDFDYVSLGTPILKGIEHPGKVFKVTNASVRAMPLEQGRNDDLTAFTGRERELQQLRTAWSQVLNGRGATLRICGPAGIGKSRLIREFRYAIKLQGADVLECRCSEASDGSFLQPVIEFILRRLALADAASVQERRERVQRMLGEEFSKPEERALIEDLLGIPRVDPKLRASDSPDKRRRDTLDLIERWLEHYANSARLCLLIEDIHWADPSTLELLRRVEANQQCRCLLLLTERTADGAAEKPDMPGTALMLEPLSARERRQMIANACAERALPRTVIDLLARRSDGVPLFIEESTRLVVTGGADRTSIPSRLHDLLAARLDQLPKAKPLAQLGATIGRSFSHPLLHAVLEQDDLPLTIDKVDQQLEELLDAGLLQARGEAPNTQYSFRHALIRDTAYNSLLTGERRQLHQIIAMVISTDFTELADTQPAMLARHYSNAGQSSEAVQYWQRSARQASANSAHSEAILQLQRALEDNASITSETQRQSNELKLQLMLGSACIATDGYGAESVGEHYARALELCNLTGDERALLKAQLGLESYHFMRADFATATSYAKQAQALAEKTEDMAKALQATWALGNIYFHQGEFKAALKQMDLCLEQFRDAPAQRGGVQDAQVMCLCYSAWVCWQLGHPDEALARAEQALQLAQTLNHPFSLAEALVFRASVHQFRGEYEQALRFAEQGLETCEEHGFAVWLAYAELLVGRLRAELGEHEAGLEQMLKARTMWYSTQAMVTRPYYLARCAEGYALCNRFEEGLALLHEAQEIVESFGERYHLAEIYRLRGDLGLRAGALEGENCDAQAEQYFRAAREFAIEKSHHSFALRAALRLARLLFSSGQRQEAISTVSDALAAVTGGRDTEDVRAGLSLLGELTQATA